MMWIFNPPVIAGKKIDVHGFIETDTPERAVEKFKSNLKVMMPESADEIDRTAFTLRGNDEPG